jgi:hypothetical protein
VRHEPLPQAASAVNRAILSLAGLALVLALALYIRWVNYVGVLRPDSFSYIDTALGILRNEEVFTDARAGVVIHAVRLAIVLPLAAVYAALGATEGTSVLWPLACSLGSVGLGFLVGRRIAGPAVGLLTALILALYPLEVMYATQLLPDAVQPFLMLLTTYLYLRGEDADLGSCRARRRFELAGAALGAAYLARLTSPVLLLFLLPYSLLRGTLTRQHAWMALGFVAVLVVAECVFFAYGGIPAYGITRQAAPAFGSARELAPPAQIDQFVKLTGMLLLRPYLRGWTAAFLLALATLLWLRPPRWWVGPLWLGALLAYLDVLSQVPVRSLPDKDDRFLTILAAPLALTIAMSVATLVTRVRRPAWRVTGAAAAGIAATMLLVVPGLRAAEAERRTLEAWSGSVPRGIAATLAELPSADVHLTIREWPAPVTLYLGYAPPSLTPGGPARSADMGATGSRKPAALRYVDLNPYSGQAIGVAEGYVLHDEQWGLTVPPQWALLGRLPPSTVLYYAPGPGAAATPAIEPRLGLDLRAAPGLVLVGAGVAPGPERWSVALDWLAEAAAPASTLYLALRDERGTPIVAMDSRLTTGHAIPASQWRAGGMYRARYELPAPPFEAGSTELLAGVDGGALVPIGRLAPVAGTRLEAEALTGVGADWDWSLPPVDGWAALRQYGHSGGRAAITRTVGARAEARLPGEVPPGRYRVWLRVYSYDRGENLADVTLNGQTRRAGWRSGDRGQSWAAVEFPENPGGASLALTTVAIGQPYAIVDLIVVEAVP